MAEARHRSSPGSACAAPWWRAATIQATPSCNRMDWRGLL